LDSLILHSCAYASSCLDLLRQVVFHPFLHKRHRDFLVFQETLTQFVLTAFVKFLLPTYTAIRNVTPPCLHLPHPYEYCPVTSVSPLFRFFLRCFSFWMFQYLLCASSPRFQAAVLFCAGFPKHASTRDHHLLIPGRPSYFPAPPHSV